MKNTKTTPQLSRFSTAEPPHTAPALNLQQQRAVHITEGPLLIIAGPGSGKTFTLVERIYFLIAEKGTPPGAPRRTLPKL